ncbi:M15 family metallopeptidase [Paenilisteria rocourtiae]|uniref:D-alanyl-D-alanine carboxypeptidase-like protein n=1 Tax=Listeria rocourtiae TaxID=647910 RepID=A0A4R6ZPP6_9LIST|nr:M15 family metallopeptidase [Listeria rocourtiae]EUJ51783.1 L-alanoyl-D-glutamate peptidase [Listeria rocourtiae FSL F6-920]TDR54174.1 D-alanyl-D-alanine carboxypeptidase-like protein [Listeria rocourtiae]
MTLTLNWLIEKANLRLNVAGVEKDLADRTRYVIQKAHAEGIYICVVNPCFRSKAEQDALYAQGRTKPGQIVTNAKGGQSNHNFGVAVDLCLYTNDGKNVVWETNTKRWLRVVAIAKSVGFKWGGDWTSFKDYPHFELYDKAGGAKKPVLPAIPNSGTDKPKGKKTVYAKHDLYLLPEGDWKAKSTKTIHEGYAAVLNFDVTSNGFVQVEFQGKKYFYSGAIDPYWYTKNPNVRYKAIKDVLTRAENKWGGAASFRMKKGEEVNVVAIVGNWLKCSKSGVIGYLPNDGKHLIKK